MTMYTSNTNYDYHYNREFQRMRYVTEEIVGNDQTVLTSPALLADLGVDVPNKGLNKGLLKKSPHFKYF